MPKLQMADHREAYNPNKKHFITKGQKNETKKRQRADPAAGRFHGRIRNSGAPVNGSKSSLVFKPDCARRADARGIASRRINLCEPTSSKRPTKFWKLWKAETTPSLPKRWAICCSK